jgi:hypothetical protein
LLALHLQLVDALQAALAELEAAVGKALTPIRQQTRLRRRDRHRHDPVPQRRPPGLLGGALPPQRRECREAPLDPSPLWRPWLKTTLVTAARAAVRTKGGYLQAQFLRLKARRGTKKAILAVAASMFGACYHMLRDGVPYRDLGADHFARRDKANDHRPPRAASARARL